MNIKKLLETQKKLDDQIRKEKGLEGQDLTANTFLALLVELGEMANEWKGFKFWSENQSPKLYSNARNQNFPTLLLEEYIDCLHFFLSLALQYKYEEGVGIDKEVLDATKSDIVWMGITNSIIYLYSELSQFARLGRTIEFDSTWHLFLGIGVHGFGFTLEQIEEAYYKKNNINHARQENGY